ncbi:Rieske (2Fe-2S) protein [Dactylosporangium aurantiacum]|uniref:Cytochrome bc1 complex Rieske iron-sulfur subunit n=1 Tax=Dactylosporangium aurantiacum TaxID=35754 RepID=A0A9Q9IRW1_9ACTN|nr:Rieske (2Fe-2S) protein [Dactylosporangium aurantiacum]UWZ58657.1 Rieske (2Fe-2S) protein [Dactylosporangium aurantiacum]
MGFATSYVMGGNTQWLGVSLAAALAGLAYGFAVWGRKLLTKGGYVEPRPALAASQEEEALLADAAGGPQSPVRRRGLVGLLLTATASLGIAALFPLRSLLAFRLPDPVTQLRRTVWRQGGLRLVTPEGQPVRAEDVTEDSIRIVVPEGHRRDGDAPAFVVRLDPARLRRPPSGGSVDGGVVAYSLLCTHAGCPVALYEEGTGRMLCPCHQSAFDLRDGARPIAGPAARPLPGLPLEVDDEGYLRARGDFTAPPGAGFWSLP